MRIRYSAKARKNLLASYRYYAAIRPALGLDFMDSIDEGIRLIVAHPQAWPPYGPRSRRYLLDRFKHGILYQIENDNILVVNIMHTSRHPKRWFGRG